MNQNEYVVTKERDGLLITIKEECTGLDPVGSISVFDYQFAIMNNSKVIQ